MGDKSTIEWTDATWNAVTGCTKVSAGCKNCYAERLAKRLQAMGNPNYINGFKVTLHPHMLDLPLRWKSPRRIFVNSMSDVHHEEIPLEFVAQMYDVMERASWHTYQLLTKRPDRMAAFAYDRYGTRGAPPHIWLGTSVEDLRVVGRIDDLRQAPAKVRFLSCEPLLGPLPDLNLSGISWVIAGGESGARHRPVKEEWIRDLRDQCRRAGIAFFFKQWGGMTSKAGGRELDGRTWDQMPALAAAG